jgi:hypothetical protein
MPNRRAHRSWASWLLGDDYDEVHEAIDRPVKRLGPRHRKLNHDPISAAVIGCRAAKRKKKTCAGGAAAGLLHIFQDFLYSSVKRRK